MGCDRIVSRQVGDGPQGALPLFQCWCCGVGQRCQRLLRLPQRPRAVVNVSFALLARGATWPSISRKSFWASITAAGGVGRCRQLDAQVDDLVIGMREELPGVCH